MVATGPKIKIYYDGVCPLCSGAVNAIEHSGQAGNFQSVAIQEALPLGIGLTEADKNVHTVDETGQMRMGSDAVIHILSYYPHWKWLVFLASLPGGKQAAKYLYGIVARNRKRWF